MDHPAVSIESIRQRELFTFAEWVAKDAETFRVAPITRRRAAAFNSNPYAEPGDDVLVVTYLDGQCIGYLGLLPGILSTENTDHRLLWISPMFVAPAFQRRGIAGLMIERATRTGMDILSAGVTDASLGAFLKFGAEEISRTTYCSIQPQKLHPNVFKSKASAKPDDRFRVPNSSPAFENQSANRKLYGAVLRSLPAASKSVKIVNRKRIPSSFNFPARALPCFRRDNQAVNWMLENKWFYSTVDVPRENMPQEVFRYYFSGNWETFYYLAYTFEENGGKGFVIASVSKNNRRSTVKCLDYHLPSKNFRLAATCKLLAAGHEIGADRIDFPSCLLSEFSYDSDLATVVKKKVLKCWGVSINPGGPLKQSAAKLRFEMYDGDLSFS